MTFVSIAFGAVVVIAIIVRLVVGLARRRGRAALRDIGGALTGAVSVQSSAYGWTPGSLAPADPPAAEWHDSEETRDSR
ncbi:MAG: hypothetical protein C0444_11495 [Microbacterium sp.]|nr:hypothetical protein [Microbacterium sp.]MBA4345344.1 hypothetical protein [Microbacterium sp.]